ncbi:MAG: SpaA isopeptide-forming pilin-related protein [Coriobacteriaceae bacterium]|nr:SpaA isopeptide-forming pilin-related protein [Coriobacteriaceae bacterium]
MAWALSDAEQTKLVEFLGADYTTWLKDKDPKTAQNALEYISQKISSSEGKTPKDHKWVDSGTFAMNLAAWAKTNLKATAQVASGTEYRAAEGYYLFLTDPSSLTGSTLATLPIWLPLGGSVTTIQEKVAPVSVTKQVKEGNAWKAYADAEINEGVDYRVQVHMPANYNGFATFSALIEDTLPAGMTLDKNSVKVFVGDEQGTNVTSSFVNQSTDAKLSVKCANTKAIKDVVADSTLTVTYRASLTDSTKFKVGGKGNASTATFTYSNDPQAATTSSVTSDPIELYTFQASLDKMDKVTKVELAGAEFVVKNQEGKYLSTANAWTADKNGAKKFVTNDQGAITGIVGLDAGTYTFEETKAPTDYSLPANNSINVTVGATYSADGMLTGLTCKVVSENATPDATKAADAATGMVNFDVVNDKELSLAVTGAAGVGLGGAAVLAIGLGWYLMRAHRKGNALD